MPGTQPRCTSQRCAAQNADAVWPRQKVRKTSVSVDITTRSDGVGTGPGCWVAVHHGLPAQPTVVDTQTRRQHKTEVTLGPDFFFVSILSVLGPQGRCWLSVLGHLLRVT